MSQFIIEKSFKLILNDKNRTINYESMLVLLLAKANTVF